MIGEERQANRRRCCLPVQEPVRRGKVARWCWRALWFGEELRTWPGVLSGSWVRTAPRPEGLGWGPGRRAMWPWGPRETGRRLPESSRPGAQAPEPWFSTAAFSLVLRPCPPCRPKGMRSRGQPPHPPVSDFIAFPCTFSLVNLYQHSGKIVLHFITSRKAFR